MCTSAIAAATPRTATRSSSIPATISSLPKIKIRVKEINLNQQGWDETYTRPTVSFETMRESGVAASIVFPMRVQRNDQYYSVDELHRAVRQESSETRRDSTKTARSISRIRIMSTTDRFSVRKEESRRSCRERRSPGVSRWFAPRRSRRAAASSFTTMSISPHARLYRRQRADPGQRSGGEELLPLLRHQRRRATPFTTMPIPRARTNGPCSPGTRI